MTDTLPPGASALLPEPLPTREARSWDAAGPPGVTTAAYSVALGHNGDGSPVVYMRHGGGQRAFRIGKGGWLDPHILSGLAKLDERELYAVLYAVARAHESATEAAVTDEATRWRQAHLDKRIKTKRRNNRRYVEIQPCYTITAGCAAGDPDGTGPLPLSVPGMFRDPENALAVAREEHPEATRFRTVAHYTRNMAEPLL